MTVAELIEIVPESSYSGPKAGLRRIIKSFSTDSRSLKKGDAFIALKGENFDGHEYIQMVMSTGASVAIVSNSWFKAQETPVSFPVVVVEDPLHAYGEIAGAHRKRFKIPVVAIAGSNGKTTTKDLVAEVLANKYGVTCTQGNLNNLIGVPVTILQITEEHTAAVVEIGTNMPGEIERLCEILQPTHGVITNIGSEHLELLRDLEGVAQEEGALFRFLKSSGGIPFINLDDPYLAPFAKGWKKAVTYGESKRAIIRGVRGELDENGAPSLQIEDKRTETTKVLHLQLKTPGLHTASNALAAAAIGLTLKVAARKLKGALENFTPLEYKSGYARLAVVKARNGATVLNDTYNANPDSIIAALDTLVAMTPSEGGRRIAVLGDMRELGKSSAREHKRIGREVGLRGITRALFVGEEMLHAYQSFAPKRGSHSAASWFPTKEALAKALKIDMTPNDIVLVKGSRGMKMEEIVGGLI